MPQIIVIADQAAGDGEPPVMFRERVTVGDFESDHFAGQLVERLGWAVGDADEFDRGARHRRADRRIPQAAPAPPAAQPDDVGSSSDDAAQRREPRSARVVTTASYTPAP
ncbi:MAG: hypothetical protein WBQ18_14435 [Solirubrobacteraceae bacterium]